jgi:hypothetical protein
MAVILDLLVTAWFIQWYGKEQVVSNQITFCAVIITRFTQERTANAVRATETCYFG